MLTFVVRSDLTTPDMAVRVYAWYDNAANIKIDQHGADKTMMLIGSAYIVKDMSGPGNFPIQVLRSDWQTLMPDIIQFEGNRRIQIVFPDQLQRTANAEVSNNQSQYGTDTSQWPLDAQQRKTEYDRGWTYVNAVMQAANVNKDMAGAVDPTDDTHWPTIVPPIQPGP
jgi:hypothetical protein